MFIGHFTEQPWQDDTTGLMGTQTTDLSISNELYDPKIGHALYNRYLDEKLYAEEMGFDGLMLNEHHSTPFCMQGVTNIIQGNQCFWTCATRRPASLPQSQKHFTDITFEDQPGIGGKLV